jgi:V/A-type H+-transporting ATPase subunit I
MIEKMHRLQLLLFYTEKKRILRGLQELGVVDLDLAQSESPRIRRAAQDANELKKSLSQIENVRKQLPADTQLPNIEMPHESGAQLELVRSLLSEKEHLENAIRELADEYARYSHWGEIPVEGIAMLAQKGIHVHLFSGSEKFFDRYDFGAHCVEVISREGNTVRFALVTYHEDAPVIPFQKYAVPGRSLSEMQAERQYLEKKLNQVLAKLASLASGVGRLQNAAAHLETRRLFETAKHSLEADKTGTVYRITGYFPESSTECVKQFLEAHALAYEITRPGASEAVPVRLKNNRLSRLFEPVTQIFSLPDYRELDPTPLFAPFFTLFFGFCMGDVGYGFLLLLVSFVLMSRRSLRGIGLLVLILSAATIVSGLLMNSFFGANLFVRDGQGLIAADKDPAIFAAYTVQGKTVFPAMTLSLLVGCAQIFVAFILQSLNETLVLGWRYGIKAAAMLLMSVSAFILGAHADFLGLGFNSAFAIGPLQVGRYLTAVPVAVAQILLVLALVLFFFVANPDRKIWLRPLAALWDFYGFATGLLGDFLSYIRLFALALAGGLLGNAFNQIAFMLLPKTATGYDFASPWLIATILVLIVGHGLNFALGALGAFVHPLRLTFVEFYKNINFRGGGRPYRPFRRVSSAT